MTGNYLQPYQSRKTGRIYIQRNLLGKPIGDVSGFSSGPCSSIKFLDHLFEPKLFTGPKPALMIEKGGVLSFLDTKNGRSLARTLIIVSSWLYPPKQDDGSTVWFKAEYPSFSPGTMYDSPETYFLGFSNKSNTLLVRYINRVGTHVSIHNVKSHKKSGWVDLGINSFNV